MKRKCLAIGIILLFVGVAIIPSINPELVEKENQMKNPTRQSPLYDVRIRNALNKNQIDLNIDYIHQDGDFSLFNFKNNNPLNTEKLIEIINNMSEKDFKNFVQQLNKKSKNIKVISFDKEKLINILDGYNKNNSYKIDHFLNIANQKSPLGNTIGEPWYLGCFKEYFQFLISLLVGGITVILEIIYRITHPTTNYLCYPTSGCIS